MKLLARAPFGVLKYLQNRGLCLSLLGFGLRSRKKKKPPHTPKNQNKTKQKKKNQKSHPPNRKRTGTEG